MAALKHFTIRRIDDSWNYVIDIADDAGGTLQLDASFEDIDRMAYEIDGQVAVLVAAAEKMGMGG